MELWIPITIAAAFVQNLRSGLQRHLRMQMGTTGATFVRFGFGLPFALLALALWLTASALPETKPAFWLWVTVGAFAQIFAQALLVIMFTRRSFAVGSAYSRTEPVQAVIFGLVLLGERAPASVLIAVAISVGGVIAQEMAAALSDMGREVGMAAALDSYPADVWRAEPDPDPVSALVDAERRASADNPHRLFRADCLAWLEEQAAKARPPPDIPVKRTPIPTDS